MRKTTTVTIATEGRDKGKVFLLTEMPASQAENWGMRALAAIGRAGIEIPDEMEGSGMAGVAAIGRAGFRLQGSLAPEDIEPLMAEMMGCVQIVPDPKQPTVTRGLVEDDIEEVATRLHLRSEVMSLHLGFSIADALSKLGALAKSRIGITPSTPTSAEPSVPLSPPASPA
jgi:hypothetical protein